MQSKILLSRTFHLGVPTEDIQSTVNFYESLGFNLVRKEQNGDVPIAFLQADNLMIEAYENKQAVRCAGALDHLCLDTPDINAAYQNVCALGYRIADPGVEELPFWDCGIRFFKFYGPNDEIIEFCQKL